ncbi:mechanosensitive ion channel domain-containing protein [Maritimibacter sp. UBA3975]|uniref:mechanosensitive ion channel family protein n=1 Tax=Maritimibacter sp. UBA3975 TaxID=1946833 RepID=UPI000C0ABF05|nr:mechanosensitive ion channel domain-containing protein [Maritimibacter sp. UBA3975]MAM63349.1 mechanosensitive ion channel protein [Maritimibacter sp.]|tara:strand:+ start:12083 stop:13501 length:1419 start_codon:yes stop_codon:yes gene_type:complete
MASHDTATGPGTAEAQSGADATTGAGTVGAGAPTPAPEDVALDLFSQAATFAQGLLRPWNAYQVGIALLIVLLAYLIARLVAPRYHGWLRSRENWPKWRMRFGVMLHRRIKLITFVALVWPTVWIMREVTWPSRSYLLAIIAQLALAWLIIAILARFITNAFLRGLVRTAGWIWVTISILNLEEETVALLDGMAIHAGEMRLSVWMVIQAIAILGALLFAARFISINSSARIKKSSDISPSMQVLVIKFLQMLLYAAAIFIGLRVVGVDLTGLAVLSGAIGVGLGFGLQKVVSNLVSGVIILLDKSIKPGDVISLGDTFGWIEQLGARYVSVVTRDGKEYLIPNEDLITGQVVNWSHTNAFVRLDIFFGTAYGDDPHKVRKVAIDAAQSVNRVLSFRPPVCHIVGFGDSSVDYILRFWIDDPTGGLTNIRGNVYLALWDAFQANGISIPFPQREVRHLNDPRKVAEAGESDN